MNFLVLGATGMAGHTISLYLLEQGHNVTAFSRSPFSFCKNIVGNITDFQSLKEVIYKNNYDVIINCIGSLNQFAEQDKANAVLLNSYLPHYLCKVTEDMETRVIHMSTDCVFSGSIGKYQENDFADGTTFYDRSKALGEINDKKNLTFRNSIIGPDMHENGIGLFNWFMKQEQKISGYTKAIWTGVTTLTLAKAMEKAAIDNLTGLYHLVNNNTINKYELLKLFNQRFKDGSLIIQPVDGINVNKSLINTRNDFNFVVPSYVIMIDEMKEWIVKHSELYSHYKVK